MSAYEDALIKYLITIKVHADFSITVSRMPIFGWIETNDELAPDPPGPPYEYEFVERADGILVGGLYGPGLWLNGNIDDEEWSIARNVHKMAKPECHRNFASLAEAKAWALWESRTRSRRDNV